MGWARVSQEKFRLAAPGIVASRRSYSVLRRPHSGQSISVILSSLADNRAVRPRIAALDPFVLLQFEARDFGIDLGFVGCRSELYVFGAVNRAPLRVSAEISIYCTNMVAPG